MDSDLYLRYEPGHEISNNLVCATSKGSDQPGSDQPAHTRSLIRAFASQTVKLLIEHYLGFLSLSGGCTVSCESLLVKMPHRWKSHIVAQLYMSNFEIHESTSIVVHSKVAALLLLVRLLLFPLCLVFFVSCSCFVMKYLVYSLVLSSR